MPSITLYANRINQMSALLTNTSKSIKVYKSELDKLRSGLLTIDSSVCNLDDVISSVRASSQTQETKAESLETLRRNVSEFVADVVRIDGDAANTIKQSQDDFYDEYHYLKPEKSVWERFKDGRKKVGEWCKGHWNHFVNSLWKKFIELPADSVDWIGRHINTAPFAILVFVTIFLKHPMIEIGKLWTKYDMPGADEVLGLIGAVDSNNDGIYHINQNSWQSWRPLGYNDGYDTVFYTAILATGNTMSRKKSVPFGVDFDGDGYVDKTYMFWSWKGDYMNLGAGAETGIYEYFSNTHWLTATNRATAMELDLYYKDQKDPLIHYAPCKETETELWNKGKQWWITGFDSQVQNVRAEDLRAVTIIDFSKMEDGEKMYEAFRNATYSSDDIERTEGWTFLDETYTAILDWEAKNW